MRATPIKKRGKNNVKNSGKKATKSTPKGGTNRRKFNERQLKMLYLITKILHLLCVCVVLGYLVYDVCVFSFFKKTRSEAEFTALKRELLKPSIALFAPAFSLMLLSGAVLASFYMGGELGFWQNAVQKMLWLKIAVIALLFVFTPISFYYILVLKKPDPFRRYYHHLALFICLAALIIAKLLFVV